MLPELWVISQTAKNDEAVDRPYYVSMPYSTEVEERDLKLGDHQMK